MSNQNSHDRYYYDCRCYVCGRFVKPDCDLDVPWGSVVSTEPPPERRYCSLCADKEKAYHIKHRWVPTCYVQAQWQIEAAAELERETYCSFCNQIICNIQEFRCKRGYWAASSPHTLKMDNGEVRRPEECKRDFSAHELTGGGK